MATGTKYVRIDGRNVQVNLGARLPTSTEVLATVSKRVSQERAEQAVRIAWEAEQVHYVGIHDGYRIFTVPVEPQEA